MEDSEKRRSVKQTKQISSSKVEGIARASVFASIQPNKPSDASFPKKVGMNLNLTVDLNFGGKKSKLVGVEKAYIYSTIFRSL